MSPIYQTGTTPEGIPLIGGVWTLFSEQGFPIEMSHLVCKGNGWAVDWLEAMADASVTHNLPALIPHMEAFLPEGEMMRLKMGFTYLVKSQRTCQNVLDAKKQHEEIFP